MAGFIPAGDAEEVSATPASSTTPAFIPAKDATVQGGLAEKAGSLAKQGATNFVQYNPGAAIGETIWAGNSDLINSALAGVTALGKGSLRALAGDGTFTSAFREEYGNTSVGIKNHFNYEPQTEGGKLLSHFTGLVIEKAIRTAGEIGYEYPMGVYSLLEKGIRGDTTKSPAGGALFETAGTAAMLLAGGKGAKGKVKPDIAPSELIGDLGDVAHRYRDPKAIEQYAYQKYPETVKNMAASSIGRTIREQTGSPDVFQHIHKQLDTDLGIKPEDSTKTPLRGKFLQYMDKLDPDQTVPVQDRLLLIDGMIDQIKEVNKLANAGKSAEQLVKERIVRPEQTIKDYVERMTGVKAPPTKAEVKTRQQQFMDALNEHQGYVIDPQTSIERPMTAGDYLAMTTKDIGKPKTARDIVAAQTKKSELTTQEIIDHVTGVTQKTPENAKSVNAALKEASGVWVADPKTGVPERQLSMGEYYETYYRGKDAPAAIPFSDLPTSAKEAVQYAGFMKSGVDPTLANASYERVRVPISELNKGRPFVPDKSKSFTEGPILVDRGGEVVDGTHRVLDAIARGEKDVEVYRPVQAGESKVASPKVRAGVTAPLGRKKQGAIFDDPAIVEKQIQQSKQAIKGAAKVAPIGTGLKGYSFDKVEEAFRKSRDYDPTEGQSALKRAGALASDKLLDTSGRVKWALEASKTPEGRRAAENFSLVNGAPSRAQQYFDLYKKDIWSGLDSGESARLDEIIRSRRIIQIDQYKGEGTVKHEGGLTGSTQTQYLTELKSKLGPENYTKLDDRATKYFKAYQDQLVQLHKNGILSDDSFLRMFNLEYSPTEALRLIDPELTHSFHGHKITVTDSGIPYMKAGQTGPVRLDSKLLLAETLSRVQARIMKNDANKALGEFALKNPDNGFVKVAEVKSRSADGKATTAEVPGWTRIDHMDGGEQHPVLMRDDLAEQWVTRHAEMSSQMANVLRTISGTSTVKFLATTVNPAFAVTNLPRDLATIWVASGEYSSFLPKYMMQMGVDLATVFPDTIRAVTVGPKRGLGKDGKMEFKDRYSRAIDQGLGMDFMAHQGTQFWDKGDPFAKMDSSWRPVMKAVEAVNVGSEIWTRLALRERALKNGKSEQAATAASRAYMDFSLGGSWVKGLDTFMPYLNATTQAFNAIGKQAARDPGRFGWQMTQALGVSTGLITATMIYNKETWDQLTTEQKLNNYIIAPKDMFIVDPQGNKRNVYFKLKVDNNLVPVHALALALAERNINGKIPDGITFDTAKAAINQLNGIPIPTLSAFAEYAANYNFWQNKQIWTGDKRNPEDEIRPSYMPNATPQMWVDFGKAFGMSPERARVAFTSIMPSNLYTDLIGGGFQWLRAGMSDYDKARTTEQMLTSLPGVSRVVSLTHPAATEIERIEKAVRQENSSRGLANDTVSGFIFREKAGEGKAIDAFKTWVETQPPEDRQRLVERFKHQYAVEKVFERVEPSQEGLPSKTWWMQTSSAVPKVRGQLFYQEWVSRDEEGRGHMLRMAKGLERFGVSYWSDDFAQTFARERAQWGVERR